MPAGVEQSSHAFVGGTVITWAGRKGIRNADQALTVRREHTDRIVDPPPLPSWYSSINYNRSMPEDVKLSQIGSSQLPPPFRGLHSPGLRKHCQIIFACYFRKSSIDRIASNMKCREASNVLSFYRYICVRACVGACVRAWVSVSCIDKSTISACPCLLCFFLIGATLKDRLFKNMYSVFKYVSFMLYIFMNRFCKIYLRDLHLRRLLQCVFAYDRIWSSHHLPSHPQRKGFWKFLNIFWNLLVSALSVSSPHLSKVFCLPHYEITPSSNPSFPL